MKPRLYMNRLFYSLLLAIGTTLIGAKASAQTMTDDAISEAIEDEYILKGSINTNHVDIETREGMVILDGKVNHLLARERAEDIALSVKGVRGVVNNLETHDTQKSDATLLKQLNQTLTNDPTADAYEVNTEVVEGIAVVKGVVESYHEKILTEKVAKSVVGLKGVENELKIVYPEERPDEEVESEVAKILKWNAKIDHALIDVNVKDGEVILSGEVGSAAEKELATVNAWVNGVESVSNEKLEVKEWARNPKFRKEKYTEKSDEAIADAIRTALFYDVRVSDFDLTVSVEDGRVKLNGIVKSLQAKESAKETARNVVGVKYVKNHIKVRPASVPDNETLEARVDNALKLNPWVEQFNITVNAHFGIVYLDGKVDNSHEKREAERATAKVKGVTTVMNNLQVQEQHSYHPVNTPPRPLYDESVTAKVDDREIKFEIRNQLWWSPFVNQKDINVSVDEGTATLTGTVGSAREKHYAELNAFEGGALTVNNKIEVK